MNRITAAQAQSLADKGKEKYYQEQVELHLKGIYSAIETYALSGAYQVTCKLDEFADAFKNNLRIILEKDGYNVKFSTSKDFEGDVYYYVTVFWKN